uniref:Uncharacterized protein n=1 Tax=Aegilops tauschii TaxID=37682 RepID=R7W8Q2_AEGTA
MHAEKEADCTDVDEVAANTSASAAIIEEKKRRAAVMVHPLHALHELLLQARSPHAALGLVFVLLVCPLLVLLVVRRLATPSTAAVTTRAREELLSRLPSPSKRLPVIGHLHLVGSLPHISLRDLAAKHGRDGLMLLRLGAVPTLVVSSPSAAEAVLRTHDHVFASRPYSPVTEILFYGPSDVAFCPYGEHWRQVKKIATTHLLTNKKVRSYRHAREHEEKVGSPAPFGVHGGARASDVAGGELRAKRLAMVEEMMT